MLTQKRLLPGLCLCLVLLTLESYAQPAGDAPYYQINSLTVQDTSLLINLSVNPTYFSGYEISAAVAGRTVYLYHSRLYGQLYGALSLNGLPENDSLTLNITIQSLASVSPPFAYTGTQQFYYRRTTPFIEQFTPSSGLARPTLPVKIVLSHGKPPYRVTLNDINSNLAVLSFTGGTSIDTTLDFSAWEGSSLQLQARIKDSDSIPYAGPYINVVTQSSAALHTWKTFDEAINDFHYNHVLYGKKVYDIPTGTAKYINDTDNLIVSDLQGYDPSAIIMRQLSPQGVVYNGASRRGGSQDSYFPYDVQSSYLRILSWNFDSNHYHQVDSPVNNTVSNGNYVAWINNSGTGFRVNHLDSTVVHEYTGGYAYPLTLAPDGTLIYGALPGITTEQPLFTYYFGSIKSIGTGSNAATEGHDKPVWYTQYVTANSKDTLLRFNPDGTTTGIATVVKANGPAFLINNGYTVFRKTTGDTSAAWLLTPAATQVKLAGDVYLFALNNKGDLLYQRSGDIYMVDHTGTQTRWLAKQVSGEQFYTVDSLFYIALANTLLTLTQPASANLTAFTATRQGSSNLLQWKVSEQAGISAYEVQRSGDNTSFTAIGKVPAQPNTMQPQQYNFTDAQPLPGANYYRLNITGTAGYQRYSDTVSVQLLPPAPRFIAYIWPNPVCTNSMNLAVKAQGDGLLRLEIVSLNGKIIQAETIVVTKGLVRKQVDVSKLRNGLYFAYLTSGREKIAIPFIRL
ncbi:T9SS type A sorting domain-containing protein [Deminuibacter soli]|uniref:T9SS C-terminal target domain-containing protein n=1 Tax=Deminuibacter soli TaxID=2291815 RepID=A0A3E1NK51_9BACT|nr:T9SS type A sorting domain-containing protein [Deminuibacter soli]RFM28293.1 T9SS C-terminal target domain-containing protein [Deminuibacter soli]